ncbi:DUF4349 domain-containing protein [Streptomyces sp. NPDC046805]|uniref:DUF4349 domain-containing protein n=1 Tax=Streptomyces sp. NPDC046805 TaxID=3155134 RepID=UPI003406CADA
MRARHSVRPARALAGTLLAASLALAGCSSADSGGTSSDKAAAGPAAQEGAGSAGGGMPGGGRAGDGKAAKAPRLTTSSIIRTASLRVRVKDVPTALDDARAAAEDAGGYVGDENTLRDSDGHERTRIVLRVPGSAYDKVLTDLQGAGKLISRTAKATDVTDQVVDVESRIKSQRASVARIRALMDRATKLGDVVTLEGELSHREADLEALLAQQASLKDRTDLATITLTLSETPVKKAAKDDDPSFLDAVSGGWHAFVTMLRWIALVLGAVAPFAALAALLALLWLRVVRPRLTRRAPSASAPAPTSTPTIQPYPRPQPSAEEGRTD